MPQIRYYVVAKTHATALNRECVRMDRDQAVKIWDTLNTEQKKSYYIWTIEASAWRPYSKEKLKT